MPTWRYQPGVAALDNKIYVTGGEDDNDQKVSSVDCYDTDTKTRSQVANMNIARVGHSLVSLHGKLYAIGGCDFEKRGCSAVHWSVEVYDPVNNTWTLLKHKLDGEVAGAGACLIKKFMIM